MLSEEDEREKREREKIIMIMAMTLKIFRPRNNGCNFSADARLFIDVDIICELTINRRSLALCFYGYHAQREREPRR